MNRRRLWLIIGAFLVVVLFVAVLIHFNSGSGKQAVIGNTERENGGPRTVVFSNTGALNADLLSEQYSALIHQLSFFVLNHVSARVRTASVNNTVLTSDGSISFTVTTDQPKDTFSSKVTRQNDGSFTLQIPQASYSITLNPYE